MVFDGRKLSPFDEELLADLQEAQAMPLEPDPHGSPSSGGSGRPRRDRQIGAVVMAAFVVLVVVAGTVIARSGSGGGGGNTDVLPGPDQKDGVAEQQVLAALGQTTAMGTMHIDYRMSEAYGPNPPASTCSRSGGPMAVFPETGRYSSAEEQARVEALQKQLADSGTQVCHSSQFEPVTVTGSGTLTLAPKAMEVSADISGGLQVSVKLQGDRIWESGGAGYGVVSNSNPGGSGQALSGFAGLVEGTLGQREGALAMTRMASPNAYLALEQPTVTGATEAGTGTIDGVAVTNYTVDVDLHQLVHSAGLSADETTTILDALGVLDQEGYQGTSDSVSVDATGMIRKVVSVTSFADGGTVTHDATYSDFGCAGPCPTTTTTT